MGIRSLLRQISFSSLILLTANATASTPLMVILDPGHGGKDRGAQVGEAKESLITMAVSRRLANRLEHDPRFQTHLTRQSDDFLSLSERVQRAEQFKGDIFLSIHVNWSIDSRAHGFEVYFQNQLPSDEESMFLAARENQEEHLLHTPQTTSRLPAELQLILMDLARNQRAYASSQLAKELKQAWLGTQKSKAQSVRQAPFFVISNLAIPSALVEIGFLSHSKEGPRLNSEEYQERVAKSLHDGLIRYYESLDKPQGPRLQ